MMLGSCTKEIDIDLNSSNPLYVIEANIDDGPGPYLVQITRTVNFSESNIYPPVTGARVVILDETSLILDTLLESNPGQYFTKKTKGIPGHKYKLIINKDNNSFQAVSQMPDKVKLDSLKFNPLALPGANNTFAAVPVYTDPSVEGNCYRFIQSVNGAIDNSYIVGNDNIGNGNVNQRPLISQNISIERGDEVSITMQCIDANVYTYYFTLSQVAGAGPGGGTTPANPPSNLIGSKALGYFSAHTSETMVKYVK